MKIGALVPARYGSKRVPHKNIKQLGDKPLICWTIDTILEAGTFQNVCVSTESSQVAEIVRNHYAKSDVEILNRPEKLAEDCVSATEVFMHYLENYPDMDFGAVFLPTYPFRSVDKIREIDLKIRSRYYWRVASESNERFCTGEYYFPTDHGLKNIFTKHHISCPIQLSTYHYNHRNCPPGMWQRYYQSPNERALIVGNEYLEDIDIDTPDDFWFAEQIAKGRKIQQMPVKEHRYGDWSITVPKSVDVEKFIDYVGRKKFESIERPLLVAKTIHHEFASSLKLTEVYGKQMFGCLEAMKYIHKLDISDPSFNSQDLRPQYIASKYYRIHRTPESYYIFTTKRDGVSYDHHGIDFSVDNIHTFSTNPVEMPRPRYTLGADTLAWDRVIMEEKLKQQNFYVEPIYFKDP